MILNDIIIRKRRDLEELKRRFPFHRLRYAAEHARRSDIRPLSRAISSSKGVHLICEIKKASPSEGIIRDDFQPLRIASIYEHGGAAALSVLTEPHFFKGRPSYLKTVRQVSGLPILRKDFILESYQLYETALLEADAFLLIASILTGEELASLISIGRELGMEALVETHTLEDLNKAVDAGAEIFGINNRNLKTLEVDTRHARSLLPHVPKGKIVVVESGIATHSDVMDYCSIGVHAFLVGTALMKSPDILQGMQRLLGDDQKWCHGEESA